MGAEAFETLHFNDRSFYFHRNIDPLWFDAIGDVVKAINPTIEDGMYSNVSTVTYQYNIEPSEKRKAGLDTHRDYGMVNMANLSPLLRRAFLSLVVSAKKFRAAITEARRDGIARSNIEKEVAAYIRGQIFGTAYTPRLDAGNLPQFIQENSDKRIHVGRENNTTLVRFGLVCVAA